jgi:hypothetical protein
MSIHELSSFGVGAIGFRVRIVLESSQGVPCTVCTGKSFGFILICHITFESSETMWSTLTNSCLQKVMLGLREKAHLSLSEHRKGQVSPLARQLSEPYSPDGGQDELAVLGGKTRLVAKKDSVSAASSPAVIDRSPTSLNPVVPLPLMSGSTHQAVDPNLVLYLQTFTNPQSHNGGPTYTDSSTYSMSPSRENAYQETSSYSDPHAPIQPMELVAGQFPSYFSVYDYGLSTESSYSQLNRQISSVAGPRRDSPENTMQTTWQEFVTQSGLEMKS